MTARFILFSGQQCCLCDDAKHLLGMTTLAIGDVQIVDVKSDPQLYHLYGARIPVLFDTQEQQELAWPFDLTALTEFLP